MMIAATWSVLPLDSLGHVLGRRVHVRTDCMPWRALPTGPTDHAMSPVECSPFASDASKRQAVFDEPCRTFLWDPLFTIALSVDASAHGYRHALQRHRRGRRPAAELPH